MRSFPNSGQWIYSRTCTVTLRRTRLVLGWVTCPGSTPGGGTSFRYVTSHPGGQANSAFHPFRGRQMSSKLIQMCATLLGRRHLVNAYEMHAGCSDVNKTFFVKTKTKTLLGPLHRLRYNGHKMNTTVYTRHRQLCMT